MSTASLSGSRFSPNKSDASQRVYRHYFVVLRGRVLLQLPFFFFLFIKPILFTRQKKKPPNVSKKNCRQPHYVRHTSHNENPIFNNFPPYLLYRHSTTDVQDRVRHFYGHYFAHVYWECVNIWCTLSLIRRMEKTVSQCQFRLMSTIKKHLQKRFMPQEISIIHPPPPQSVFPALF